MIRAARDIRGSNESPRRGTDLSCWADFLPANFSSQSSGFRFANQVCIRNSPKAAA